MDIVINEPEALEAMRYDTVIGVDIETSGISPFKDTIMVVAMHGEPSGTTAVLHVRGYLTSALREFLTLPKTWIYHNGVGFDVMFFHLEGIPFPSFYDTMVAEQVLNTSNRADVRKSLSATMKRRLGTDFKEKIDHRTWRERHLTVEQLSYAANDVRHLPRLRDIQLELVKKRGLEASLEFETKLMPLVVKMQLNGLAINQTVLDEELDRVAQETEQAAERLGDLNVNSPKQVKEALHARGLKVPNTAKQTLMTIAMHGHDTPEARFCRDVLAVRQSRKRTGMYDEKWVYDYVDGGRVHARFWQAGTGTMRFSSSDPNLQQIPRDFRRVIGNEVGHQVVQADYSQLELRVLADVAQDEHLVEALQDEDIHSYMASVAYNKPIEEVTKEERRDAKSVTFTWAFVGGPKAVTNHAATLGVNIPPKEAGQLLGRYHKRFRGVSDLHQRAMARSRYGNAVNVYLPEGGRRTLIGDNRKPQTLVNTLVQGTAAVGMKKAIMECERRGLMSHIGATIHDELLATSVPNEDAMWFGEELRDAMSSAMETVCDVPIEVDVDINPCWVP